MYYLRMTIDNKGHLLYSHQRDANWDVNDFLLELKSEPKYWRDVYWRVWGYVNFLQCSRCKETFPCAELGNDIGNFYPTHRKINLQYFN